MTSEQIISALPYQYPFLFVDRILTVDKNAISGTYKYDEKLPFYEGHFKNRPVTPGVILTETMAQIGLVALGIYLLKSLDNPLEDVKIALTNSNIDFFKPVFPAETVLVKSEKEYFRFNKLKCKVQMFNQKDELVCRGTLAGMMKI